MRAYHVRFIYGYLQVIYCVGKSENRGSVFEPCVRNISIYALYLYVCTECQNDMNYGFLVYDVCILRLYILFVLILYIFQLFSHVL